MVKYFPSEAYVIYTKRSDIVIALSNMIGAFITETLKGKYHENLMSFQNQKCLSDNRNKKIV